MATTTPKFRIYPSIGIARLGNGPATKDQVIFSPEIPWENLYETDQNYLTKDGRLKKQAQRFYIYECDDKGNPTKQINTDDFDIEWSVEVANKKPFWYDFNNSLDLSVIADNQNLSPNFVKDKLAPGIGAQYRNPNVLNQELRVNDGYDYRKDLVNHPSIVSVDGNVKRKEIKGQFPSSRMSKSEFSMLAKRMNIDSKEVNLGTVEYDDDGTLIFYGADGVSASLNPSDLNTDFADNSNWYDDICDGRITASIRKKDSGEEYKLDDANSAAWVASAPPDYAPQIQPLSTMFDLITGAANEKHTPELATVFPMLYRLYRMQWVNLGDFLAPSFKETIDELIASDQFKYIYKKEPKAEADAVREKIFNMFRNPAYNKSNEPIIPSKNTTDLTNRGSGTDELKLPYYPGDAIDYPGSPAQWFAIPPMIYGQLRQWRDGNFYSPDSFNFKNMDEMGEFYREQFLVASKDEKRKPLLMTRAVLETLYGGGFHPGVELTWPMRHNNLYAENKETYRLLVDQESMQIGAYGLREVRLNLASKEEQERIFYNDFGFMMTSDDIRISMEENSEYSWFWKVTPGDLTKWMGIPWQSDAGSCQAVYVEKQYPVPSWWAANLPVHVLPKDSYEKLLDPTITDATKRNIYANRLEWLHTASTGFIGYHAEGGYLNGLINMVYQWKDIGVVTGRRLDVDIDGIPEIVYVAYDANDN
ncbi:LodA/GoxA family CTQ-dependent oxidase [Kordia jejudonensis]|uniref:LodA/GoxA family CTQ-dependent oxidase n=1 Tax=Kordia jejudonensis TaxID=1348245 RepID=UPI00062992B3|nr:LodA/GoxA family CTQ-dependent oxidase [Kordia jejudonensis]